MLSAPYGTIVIVASYHDIQPGTDVPLYALTPAPPEPQRAPPEPLSALDWREHGFLSDLAAVDPDAMTSAAWTRLLELEDWRQACDALERARIGAKPLTAGQGDDVADALTLTAERVRDLEKMARDPEANMTQTELEEWFAVVRASQPEFRGHVDAGGLWQIDDDCDQEWDRWYNTPVHVSWARIIAPRRSVTHTPPRSDRRITRPRRRRTRRARAPARPEDEPDPPLDVVPLETFRRDLDAWIGGVR
jgi:hypothetical protein